MSPFTPYVSLVVFPLAALLVANPIGLYWEVKNGPAPMPVETIEEAEKAGRYMLLVIHALVVMSVLGLIWHYQIPFAGVGLHLERAKFHVLVGFCGGIFWVGYQRVLLWLFPALKSRLETHYLQKGSGLFWVIVFVIGAFAEEFWLAACLFSLTQRDYGPLLSVTLTAVAFAAGHAKMGLGGALKQFVFGISQALIFMWLGSLLATCLVHLISNLGGFYWIRVRTSE